MARFSSASQKLRVDAARRVDLLSRLDQLEREIAHLVSKVDPDATTVDTAGEMMIKTRQRECTAIKDELDALGPPPPPKPRPEPVMVAAAAEAEPEPAETD